MTHGTQLTLGVVGEDQGRAIQGASSLQLHNGRLQLSKLSCFETRISWRRSKTFTSALW